MTKEPTKHCEKCRVFRRVVADTTDADPFDPARCLNRACSCHHKPQPKEVCGVVEYDKGTYDSPEVYAHPCPNLKPCPDHEGRGVARLNTADAHDAAGLEGWLNDWMPNTDGLTLDGDSRGAKDRLRAVFAKALSSSEKAARVEELEWVLGENIHVSRDNSRDIIVERQRIHDRLAALKVDLKEGT